MTERTVRSLAKQLAGMFYEEPKRTVAFRAAFPTFRHYLRGHQVVGDGTIKQEKPGWQYHVNLARKMLALMLGQPDSRVSPRRKEQIFDALIEDRSKSQKGILHNG